MAAAASAAKPTPANSAVVFGSLIDLARVQTGDDTAEICEACSTINLGSARFCKGCAHKLPAYYASMDEEEEEQPPPSEGLRRGPTRIWAAALTGLWMALMLVAA